MLFRRLETVDRSSDGCFFRRLETGYRSSDGCFFRRLETVDRSSDGCFFRRLETVDRSSDGCFSEAGGGSSVKSSFWRLEALRHIDFSLFIFSLFTLFLWENL